MLVVSGSTFQGSSFVAKPCNTIHTATNVAAPQHEAFARSLAVFLASNLWTTRENHKTMALLLIQRSKLQKEMGGRFILVWFFFPEQWHLPFQVASKVVSILCSGFWIFLFLFPAAPTLDGPFAIVLALICTKVDSPAGRNLLLLEVWPSYCPTLAIFLHCCFRDGQPQLQAFANCSQWQEGQQVSTSTQAFRPNKCKYLKADYLDEQRNHTCGLFFPSLPLSLQQHEMKRNGGSEWTSQPGTILRTGWRLWLRLTECFRHRKSISSSPSPSEPAWRKHWLTDSR